MSLSVIPQASSRNQGLCILRGPRPKLVLAGLRPGTCRGEGIRDFCKILTGLHRGDVKRSVDVLRALTEKGNIVVVIEHNLDLIWASDYVIDLGPGSGDKGGRIIGQGSLI